MKTVEFQTWIGRLNELTARQRAGLQGLLAGLNPSPEAAVTELLESQRAEQNQCPHCGGVRLLAWGNANGLRRRRCADCRRTFNALTGTPLARLRQRTISSALSVPSSAVISVSVSTSIFGCAAMRSTR